MPHHLISSAGSDRATAYEMSNKIVRADGRLYLGWLEAARQPGEPTRAMLGVWNLAAAKLAHTMVLGEGSDNHCGPALAMDGGGRLHALVGAHHGPFLYRYSDRPGDPASWSAPEPLGPKDTYPSLVIDASGTLHLAHREQAERWQLWYRRRRPGRPWEPPVSLAISPTPGYNHYMQALALGPTGTLHLVFQFHYAESGRAIDCEGRAIVHLCSPDGGDTWWNEGMRCDALPITIETMRPICHHAAGGVRLGNLVVDAQDRPWLFASVPGHPSGALWRREEGGWAALDLAEPLGGLNAVGGRSSSLSCDAAGHLHLALAADPNRRETRWFDPSHEIHRVVLNAKGELVSHAQVTDTNPASARWLPALEAWDWNRRNVCCADGPWLMYTDGLNAGGIGGNNANTVQTGVYLLKA